MDSELGCRAPTRYSEAIKGSSCTLKLAVQFSINLHKGFT